MNNRNFGSIEKFRLVENRLKELISSLEKNSGQNNAFATGCHRDKQMFLTIKLLLTTTLMFAILLL
jgi:hypothetical protein